jgi:hypothetical protein
MSTGLFGFIIGLVIPSSLQLITNRYFAAKYPSHPDAGKTAYSNFLGSSLVAAVLFAISIVATACGFATVKF